MVDSIFRLEAVKNLILTLRNNYKLSKERLLKGMYLFNLLLKIVSGTNN